MTLEHWRHGNKLISILLAILVWYVGAVLVICRVHYSIDIPVGIMCGAWAHYWIYTYMPQLQLFLRRIFNKSCVLKIKYFAEV